MTYYDLERIKTLIRQQNFRITVSAMQSAHIIGFSEADICDCIVDHLNESHFYKSMPAEKFPELWQDVYKIFYRETRIYLKLQISYTGRSVIISFKEDTS